MPDKPPFLNQSSRGPSYPPKGDGQLATPNNPSGQVAPAGPMMGADNPVRNDGQMTTTGGFTCSPGQTPLHNPNDHTAGTPRPPSGGRR